MLPTQGQMRDLCLGRLFFANIVPQTASKLGTWKRKGFFGAVKCSPKMLKKRQFSKPAACKTWTSNPARQRKKKSSMANSCSTLFPNPPEFHPFARNFGCFPVCGKCDRHRRGVCVILWSTFFRRWSHSSGKGRTSIGFVFIDLQIVSVCVFWSGFQVSEGYFGYPVGKAVKISIDWILKMCVAGFRKICFAVQCRKEWFPQLKKTPHHVMTLQSTSRSTLLFAQHTRLLGRLARVNPFPLFRQALPFDSLHSALKWASKASSGKMRQTGQGRAITWSEKVN